MTNGYVLDASAVLALMRGETGAKRVLDVWEQSIVSAVNVSEVAAKLVDSGLSSEQVTYSVRDVMLITREFDSEQALEAGLFCKQTRSKGLSMGDRACLALAKSTDRIALTADRAWAELDVGVEIELLR
jgi:ribonuclease VapC